MVGIADSGGSDPRSCPVCGGAMRLWSKALPTFIHGGAVDTLECTMCRLVHAWPMAIPDGLYEAMYLNADKIGGYTRYGRYARHVETKKQGLRYLAEQEDMYWAVFQMLRHSPESRSWRMLDVGSGLGYVTAALRSEGYDCTGIDIAATAVTQARARFGPWFHEEDVFAIPADRVKTFDTALILETIEHVPDPVGYLTAVEAWLRPGGRMLVTTPNRNVQPDGARWRSDLPPVHLYWFSERAVEKLADRLGLAASFIDFSDFNRTHLQTIDLENLAEVSEPSLDAAMRPLRPVPATTRIMERLREYPPLARIARVAYDRGRSNRARLTSSRSFSLAVVLTMPT